jgi:hypothetical protein
MFCCNILQLALDCLDASEMFFVTWHREGVWVGSVTSSKRIKSPREQYLHCASLPKTCKILFPFLIFPLLPLGETVRFPILTFSTTD